MRMGQREIRVAHFHFRPEFQFEQHFQARFPCLGRKYRLVPDQERPDIVVFSVFHSDGYWLRTMPAPPDVGGAPTLFITGENTVPDMDSCDFAISFCREIDSPNHMRIPSWVQRLNQAGITPRKLLSAERQLGQPGERFCAFIHRSRIAFREEFVGVLSRRGHVDAPGRSMNNMPAIGGEVVDKLNFLHQHRFVIAFENAASPGYTTEKLPEAQLAGAVPIYWGDPLVGLDFNPGAFLNLADYGSMDGLADAVMVLDSDPAVWRRKRDQPAYAEDRLPDCADDERIFAFWESVLEQVARRPDGRPAVD
jgi:hypothetical protein